MSGFDVPGFQAFKERAVDPNLSQYEKIGFPDEYRAGKASIIVEDILGKLTVLNGRKRTLLDVGAGCSDLPLELMRHCDSREHQIVLVDSAEMLDQLPDRSHVTKICGLFPACLEQITATHQTFDAVLVYSVIQYVFAEANLWAFVDSLAGLLADGGQLLIGDIPNASRRKRFLASPAGMAHHQQHYGNHPPPDIRFNRLEPGSIDDAVMLGIVGRMRSAGYDAFIVPQGPALPMANRREDILVCKP